MSRALGVAVTEAESDVTLKTPGFERERVTFLRDGARQSLLLERHAADRSLEVRLLPFLARKGAPVPAVHARGEPKVAGAAHWLLREDTSPFGTACDGEPVAVMDAKLAVERSVADDGPALRALGVPARTPVDIVEEIAAVAGDVDLEDARLAAKWLRRWPAVLCHGDLRCEAAVQAPSRIVLTSWSRAHLGCGLLDAVRLAADLAERGDAILGVDLPKKYAEAADVPLSSDTLRGAELIDRLARRHLRA